MLGDYQPIRLAEACETILAGTGLTPKALRREAARGRLEITRIAGKDFVTAAALREMIERCRVQSKRPISSEKPERSGASYWVIKDGNRRIATGCAEADVEGAERALVEYRAAQYEPAGGNHPATVAIADVLLLYARDKGPLNARPKELAAMIERLNAAWGNRKVIDIKGATCREYARRRGAKIAARNELSVLRAAVNHWHREHTLTAVPIVTLPSANPSRIRWLQREEAARLLRVAWRARQTLRPGKTKRAGRPQIMSGGATKRHTSRHVARLLLIGLYTGTRTGAILDLHWQPNTVGGWIDLKRGVMYRRAEGGLETKKRTPPVRLPRRLLAHLRRWRRLDDALPPRLDTDGNPLPRPVVHWQGRPVRKIHKAFRSLVAAAELGADVTPHVLRHTRATWLMQAGVDIWEAAGSLGMTVKMLEDTYGHHHPDFQKEAADAY